MAGDRAVFQGSRASASCTLFLHHRLSLDVLGLGECVTVLEGDCCCESAETPPPAEPRLTPVSLVTLSESWFCSAHLSAEAPQLPAPGLWGPWLYPGPALVQRPGCVPPPACRCTHVWTHRHTHVHRDTCTQSHMDTHKHIHTQARRHTQIHTLMERHMYTQTHTHTWIHKHTHVHRLGDTQRQMHRNTHTYTQTHTAGAAASARVPSALVVSVSFCFSPRVSLTFWRAPLCI